MRLPLFSPFISDPPGVPSHPPAPRRVRARLRRRPAGDLSGGTVWLFDLDNTLHDASHAIFPAINRLMTAYVARVLNCDEATASQVRVDYWQRYGATLLGMIRHHGVDPADFLRAAHDFPELAGMVKVRRGLATHLRRLPGRKILVTNAPQDYARAVLDIAGVGHCFERVVAIEQMWVHGHLRPKPDRRMLRRLLAQTGIAAHRAMLVEDTLSHLKRYAGTGIRTAWVTGYLRTIAPSRPHAVSPQEADGSRGDAAVRSTLEAEDRGHVSHAAQERSVTVVAAEAQVPPAPASVALAPQSQPAHVPRVRARVPNRPPYVDIKVQSMHQLQRRMRGIGS